MVIRPTPHDGMYRSMNDRVHVLAGRNAAVEAFIKGLRLVPSAPIDTADLAYSLAQVESEAISIFKDYLSSELNYRLPVTGIGAPLRLCPSSCAHCWASSELAVTFSNAFP